jgi:nucleoside-diphosphate-sugar epimerase
MQARDVFVTGGTGYIGQRLIPELLARGHRVRALARAITLVENGDPLANELVREVYPDLDPAFGSALDDAYRTGRPWSSGVPAAVRWTHEDGSVRDGRVNLIFQPLRDATGAVVGLLHIGAEEGAEPKS